MPAKDYPSATMEKCRRRLQKLRFGFLKWRPSFILALRAVLGYAISALSPAADAAPPPTSAWAPIQHALNLAMTTALGIHPKIPKKILQCPIECGGFGVPCLSTLFSLRSSIHAEITLIFEA